MRGITSISFSKSPTGEQELSKAVIKYKNELGQVVTETMGWKNITDETGNVISKVFTTLGNLRIVDNIGTQEKQLDKLKNKILELQNSGQFQSAPIKSLFNRLEKIDLTNIQKAEQGITNLQQSVERFSNNQPKIKSLANIKQQVEQLKASLKNENTDIFSNIMSGKEGIKLTTLMKQLETQFTSLRKGSGTFNTGDIDKTVQNVKNQMAVLQREFNKNIGIDKLITKAETAFNKLQLNSSQLNPDVLQKLQAQFNNFNTKTASNEITNFIQRCNQLGKTDSSVLKVQKAISSLNNSMRILITSNGDNLKSSNELTEYSNKLKELKSLMNQMKNGTFINSGTLDSSILSANNSFDRLSGNVSKIDTLKSAINSIKNSYDNLRLGNNKEIFGTLDKSTVNEYQKAYQELLNMRNKLKLGNGKDISFKNINDSIDVTREKLKVLQRDFNKNIGIDTMINKAQTALSRLGDKSALLDSGALKKFQDQFNSFSTKTSVDQIQKFIDEVNRISKNGDQINKIDSQLNKLQTNLMKLKIENGTDYLTNDKTISYFNELKSKVERIKKGSRATKKWSIYRPYFY